MTQEQLILDYRPLALKIARAYAKGLPWPQGSMDRRDVEQNAMVGLVKSATTYDPSRQVAFGPYARRRIRGEIIDCLRRNDYLSRGIRSKIKRGEIQDLPQPSELPPNDRLPGDGQNPEALAITAELGNFIQDLVATLPVRLQVLLRAYYWRDETFCEVGKGLGVGEGRTSQLHSRAIQTLRDYLKCQP